MRGSRVHMRPAAHEVWHALHGVVNSRRLRSHPKQQLGPGTPTGARQHGRSPRWMREFWVRTPTVAITFREDSESQKMKESFRARSRN
jgi:hypothetical protein